MKSKSMVETRIRILKSELHNHNIWSRERQTINAFIAGLEWTLEGEVN